MTQPDDLAQQTVTMTPTRRWTGIILIAAVGCLAALPFRRSEPSSPGQSAADDTSHVSRFARTSDLTGPPTMAQTQLPPALPFVGQTKRPEPLPEPETAAPPATHSVSIPPAIPATYEPLVEPRQPQPDFIGADEPTEAANILPQHLRELSRQQRWPVETRQGTERSRGQNRPYRIRDGDTLSSIAQRYLGRPERAQEVFELNRDKLTRPDMLPLGETILLPPASR